MIALELQDERRAELRDGRLPVLRRARDGRRERDGRRARDGRHAKDRIPSTSTRRGTAMGGPRPRGICGRAGPAITIISLLMLVAF